MLRPESVIGRLEMQAQRDPIEYARRLTAYKRATERTVWREQPNGEWWRVPLIDGSSSSSSLPPS